MPLTWTQTKEAMAAIAMKRAEDYGKRLKALDPAAKTERKVLAMSKRIAEQCAIFTNLGALSVSERRVFGGIYHDLDKIKPVFDRLSKDERDSFLAFADAVLLVRHVLRDRREAILEKENEASAAEVFEAENILGVTGEILAEWTAFWEEKGCLSCREIL